MATGGSTSTPTREPDLNGQPPSSYDQYIYQQLRRTQNYVRLVDIAEALLTVGVAALAYLLIVTIVDHWLLRGGLTTTGRFLAWGLLGTGVAVYITRKILPHILTRVSWLYAADAIERAEPSLKNSVLNFLSLRSEHRGIAKVVYQGMEQQAAADLSKVPVESVIDRSRIVRIGYVLVGVVLACAVYKIASPKDLLPSFGRVLAPWSDIAPQTRVKIRNVEPGDTETLLLSHLEIRADVQGLRPDEPVTLFYTSVDQRAVDVPLPMYVQEGQLGHSCQLPDDPNGLSQDVTYRIEAGDCTSATYSVQVVVAPTIHVKKIEYKYPKYTRLEARTAEGIGDIKAIEGTQVVIHAEASHDIGSAYVHLEGVRNQTVPMKVSGRAARCKLILRRKSIGSESLPIWANYRLEMTTPEDQNNENPIVHRIEITLDLPPLVEIIKPEKDKVSVPLDGQLDIEIRSRDPDYQLSDLRLIANKSKAELLDESLAGDQQPLEGPIRTSYRFVPADHKLKSGDVVRYSAIATDNKDPNANRSETDDYEIVITEPEHSDTIPRQSDQETDREKTAKPDEAADGDGGSQEGQSQRGQNQGSQKQRGGKTAEGDQEGEGEGTTGSEDGAESSDAGEKSGEDGLDSPDGSAGDRGESKQKGGETGDGGEASPGQQPSENQDGQGEGSPQDNSSSGRQQGGSSQESDQPVDNPGDAFEKAAEYIHEKEKEQDQVASAERSEDEPSQDESSGKPSSKNPQDGTSGQPADGAGEGDDTGGKDGVAEQADGAASDHQEPGPARPDDQTRPDDQKGVGEKPDASPDGGDQESKTGSRPEDGEGGGGEGTKGDGPTPPPEGKSRPRDKTGEAKQGNEQDGPSDSSVSDRDANSAEGEDGSKSGQGKKGGGQESNQEGQGASGSNTDAETGGNASQQSGKGDDSPQAGDASASDKPTGSKSDQTGDASTGEGSPGGDSKTANSEQKSDDSAESQQQPSPEQQSSSDSPGKGTDKPGTSQNGGSQAGDPTGNGLPQGQDGPRGQPSDDGPRIEPGADEGNLEYAREQTDLVLDYLQDQLDKGGVDEELKKRFGWTDEQFADFVRRYGELRERAKTSGGQAKAAQTEFDDALRSLGLRQPSKRVRTGSPEQKKADGLQQSGRSRPPLELQEQFDEFRKDAFKD